MTYEEAIKRLKDRICCEGAGGGVYHFCTDGCMYGEDECEVSLAIKALGKQIPKKPKIDRITYVGGQGYFDELYCPICNNLLIQRDDSGVYFAGGRNRFCEVCGQKLAWGNEQ